MLASLSEETRTQRRLTEATYLKQQVECHSLSREPTREGVEGLQRQCNSKGFCLLLRKQKHLFDSEPRFNRLNHP